MSRTTSFLLGIVFLLCSACARPIETPILELNRQYAMLSPEKIQEAIIQACTYEGWTVQEKNASSVHASLNWKNKHFVDVSIHYDAHDITILYIASRNMDYKNGNPPKIHNQYNKWVKSLADCIHGYLDLEVSQAR